MYYFFLHAENRVIIKTSKTLQFTSLPLFCWHNIFPPLLIFHLLRVPFAEKLDWEDVYFPFSSFLLKIEPTLVRLILLLFETVYVTGNLNAVWRSLTSLVYLHYTDVFQRQHLHMCRHRVKHMLRPVPYIASDWYCTICIVYNTFAVIC